MKSAVSDEPPQINKKQKFDASILAFENDIRSFHEVGMDEDAII